MLRGLLVLIVGLSAIQSPVRADEERIDVRAVKFFFSKRLSVLQDVQLKLLDQKLATPLSFEGVAETRTRPKKTENLTGKEEAGYIEVKEVITYDEPRFASFDEQRALLSKTVCGHFQKYYVANRDSFQWIKPYVRLLTTRLLEKFYFAYLGGGEPKNLNTGSIESPKTLESLGIKADPDGNVSEVPEISAIAYIEFDRSEASIAACTPDALEAQYPR